MSSLAGSFLVARSSLRDAFFGRAVILLLQHGPEGAFGLVLNRPAQAKDLPFPVFVGGPCKMDGLLMIHGNQDWAGEENGENMLAIGPGIFLGTTAQFEKASNSEEVEKQNFRVFTGYAGWGPKQLESELDEDSWIVLPADGEILFDTPVQDLWERLAPPSLHRPSLN
jgi:putative transcriptional regulator